MYDITNEGLYLLYKLIIRLLWWPIKFEVKILSQTYIECPLLIYVMLITSAGLVKIYKLDSCPWATCIYNETCTTVKMYLLTSLVVPKPVWWSNAWELSEEIFKIQILGSWDTLFQWTPVMLWNLDFLKVPGDSPAM